MRIDNIQLKRKRQEEIQGRLNRKQVRKGFGHYKKNIHKLLRLNPFKSLKNNAQHIALTYNILLLCSYKVGMKGNKGNLDVIMIS